MDKKITRKYYFSVEGETEKLYLKWLASQINNSSKATSNVQFDVKVEKSPIKRVKQINALSSTEVIHVFDFEEIEQEEQFKKTLEEMKKAEKTGKKIRYLLGYTNYTFELWILLHKRKCLDCKTHRRSYLRDINMSYNEKFESLSEYKEKNNFNKLLNNLSLDDVIVAIANAQEIITDKQRNDFSLQQHKSYQYYRDNPSLNIHEHILKILNDTEIIS